jgi:hypothetical protein
LLSRKRLVPDPRATLTKVLRLLERDRVNDGRAVVGALLGQGPLLTSDALLREMGDDQLSVEDLAVLIAELRAFLRSIVRRRGHGFGEPIGTHRLLSWRAAAGEVGDDMAIAAEGTSRDLVIQQFVLLLLEVGLSQVRICAAPTCERAFVKTWRREFCSLRCQKRTNTARNRRVKREREAQRARAQRRRQLQRGGA